MSTRLLGGAEIRQLAEELDLRPTKSLGQNFVTDGNTIRRIIATAQLEPEETVLEIGPGLGSLTLGLLDVAAAVIAVEIDQRLAARLPQTVASYRPESPNRLQVVARDALQLDTRDLAADSSLQSLPTALVANLPYNIAVPVVLHILAKFPSITHGLVMVQEEVADRLVAAPGNKTYGVPSVKAAWYGEFTKVGVVGKNVFWPAPQVSSGLVAFQRHSSPLSDAENIPERQTVFALIDAAFAQRRKTLRAALSGWAGGAAEAERILISAGIDPQLRGERLDINQFIAIAQAKEQEDDGFSFTKISHTVRE